LPGKTAGQDYRERLPGKAAGQGSRSRLPGKAAGQCCRARLHAMVQYAEKHGEIGPKCSILINVSARTRTTKQNLDPRCTYVPTRVKTRCTNVFPKTERYCFKMSRQVTHEYTRRAVN
jgi:hypothetical protein